MVDGYFQINNLSSIYARVYIYYICIYYYAFEISLTSFLVITTQSLLLADLALSPIGNLLPDRRNT